MADLSLDELIRRRGLNAKGTFTRPGFRRGGGLVGRNFDARQKIGVGDVRQRLGGVSGAFQVKDAREKLTQKDARFRIRGRGGTSASSSSSIQDARQMINSRKQQLQVASHLQSKPQQTHVVSGSITTLQGVGSRTGLVLEAAAGVKKPVDARDRLSLKRSIAVALPTVGSPLPIKITKTIQQRPVGMTNAVRVNVPNRNAETTGTDGILSTKQVKTSSVNSFLHTKAGAIGAITKVVQNDAYTAPAPPAPVRSVPPRATPAPIQPVSRTLVQREQTAGSGDSAAASAAAQPMFSPLEGTKMTVTNLHPRVTEEDIVELFCVCGALKRARLLKVGVAEVVFVKREDAVTAYRKYNNRCLDGQPMKCSLHMQGNVITSDQSILLRLSDTPGGGGGAKKDALPTSRSSSRSSQPTPEVDPQTILKALFKSSPQAVPSTETPNSQSTAFRIKI